MKTAFPLNFILFGLAVVSILVATVLIFWPNKINPNARSMSPRDGCIQNLFQIDAAANQFALEKGLTNGQAIRFPDDLTPYIKLNSSGKIPPYPAGGDYHINKVGETPTCTLSTATPAHVLP